MFAHLFGQMMNANQLLYESIIDSGDLHLATRDGETMFFHDSIDFSSYAGTDAGSTPYKFVFTDNAGKVATAYGGAAGGGETLGSELVLNGGMESGDPPDNWAISSNVLFESDSTNPNSGLACGKLTSTASSSRVVSQTISTNIGGLYKYQIYARADVGETILIQPKDVINFSTHVINSNDWVLVSGLRTMLSESFSHRAYVDSDSGSGWIDDASLRPYTDVPSTGLHLMSTKNGTIRNMASMDDGFDPNKIVKVEIYG